MGFLFAQKISKNRKTICMRSGIKYLVVSIIIGLITFCSYGESIQVKTIFDGNDIIINAGLMNFSIPLPELISSSGKRSKPVIENKGTQSILTYSGDAKGKLIISIEADGGVTFAFSSLKGAESCEIRLFIPYNLANISKWYYDSCVPIAFPAFADKDFPSRKFSCFNLTDSSENSFSLTLKSGPLVGTVQDYRLRQWKIFVLSIGLPLHHQDNKTLRMAFSGRTGEKAHFAVDRFGQPFEKDFPGKVKTKEELQCDNHNDVSYYSSFHPPKYDPFGGMSGSGKKYQLKGTGFFRVDKADGRDVLVTPDGNVFFHLGVCCLNNGVDYTYIAKRENIYEWLPEHGGIYEKSYFPQDANRISFYIANVITKTGREYDSGKQREEMASRARCWGFNSFGAWSGHFSHASMPYTPELSCGGSLGYFFDPFDEKELASIDQRLASRLKPLANDPMLLGYFIANEQPYGNIPRLVMETKAPQPLRLAFLNEMRKKYRSINALNHAWGTSLKSFDDLRGMVVETKTEAAWDDVAAFSGIFVDRYFREISRLIRKNDPNHLLLGARFLPAMASMDNAAKACAEYCDVFSINYYTDKIDSKFLDKVAKNVARPIILSEFSFGTSEQGLSGGVRDVRTQQERGLAYRDYVEHAACLPYIVGIQWFTMIDQPLTGNAPWSYNGENMNTGLLSVTDRPYKKCIDEIIKTNYEIYEVMLQKRVPFANRQVGTKNKQKQRKVMQAPKALPGHKLSGNFIAWPGRPAEHLGTDELVENRGGNDDFNADFWLCWDMRNLYVFATIKDETPARNDQSDKNLWSGDSVELFFGPRDTTRNGGLLFDDRQLIVAASQKLKYHWHNTTSAPVIQTALVLHPDKHGYVMEIAIPWTALRITPQPGLEFLFDLGVDESDNGLQRKRQLIWSGTDRNNADRSYWGIVKLVN